MTETKEEQLQKKLMAFFMMGSMALMVTSSERKEESTLEELLKIPIDVTIKEIMKMFEEEEKKND
jgi:hypothetical protein